jgi:hypothetical protein
MLALLAAAVLWMGLQPKPFTDVMQVSVTELLKHVATSEAELTDHDHHDHPQLDRRLSLKPGCCFAACVVTLADLFFDDPERQPTFWLAQTAVGRLHRSCTWWLSTPESPRMACRAWS